MLAEVFTKLKLKMPGILKRLLSKFEFMSLKNFYDFLYFSLFRYDSDLDGFKAEARACVQEWKDRIYEPASSTDPHFPAFSPYQAHIHEPVRATMMAEARKHEVICIFLKILKMQTENGIFF